MSALTAAFRRAVKPITKESFEDVVTGIKSAKSGIRTIDDVFENLHFKLVDDKIMVNGVSVQSLEYLLRRGDLISLFNRLDKPSAITLADEIRFRNLLETPEVKLREMEEHIKTAKLLHPDLDVIVKSMDDLEKLPAATKSKLKRFYDSLTASKSVKVAGILAGVAVGVPYLMALLRATASRNGFFVVERVNGQTNSYKIASRSCINNDLNGKPPYKGHISLDNVALYMLYAINNSNDQDRKKIATLAKVPELNSVTFKEILNDREKFKSVRDYYYSSDYTGPDNIPDPCSLIPPGQHVTCTSWNTTESETSLEYYNPFNLPDNMTFVCVTNSSLIETMVDLAGDSFSKLFSSPFFKTLGNYLIYVFIGLLVLIAGLIVRFLGFKFNLFKKKDPEYKPLLEEEEPIDESEPPMDQDALML